MQAPDKVAKSLAIAFESIANVKAAGFAGVVIAAMGWEDKLYKLLDID